LFIDNGELMKKMAFPRVCLPLIAGGGALLNNILLLVAIFAVFAALGHYPDHHVLWLPLLMGLTLLLGMGLGLVLGVLNVFMRDIGQVVPVIRLQHRHPSGALPSMVRAQSAVPPGHELPEDHGLR
jgi:lipopolysaccharide transport system permease protein